MGLLEVLPERALAIVGTRVPLPRSTYQLRKWILELSGEDFVIVSGFARGIDTAAHQAALDAHLPTIAVLGSGLDIPYPSQNSDLRNHILAADGLLVSEHPLGTDAFASHFKKRNRIIAAWSKATLVVEASQKSGALNTAKWARDHGTTCLAVPCFPNDPRYAGNQDLIDHHAAVPFWGVESLGSVWLDYANFNAKRQKQPKHLELHRDELLLITHTEVMMARQGPVTVQELLDWALSLEWSPQRFFDALERSINNKTLLDKNGLLLKNPQMSD